MLDGIQDLLLRRPDVLEVDRAAGVIRAESFIVQVNIDRAGQRISYHQRRRGQEIGAHIRADAPAEVAVAAQYGSRHQIRLIDTASRTASGRGPLLPMQVVQP